MAILNMNIILHKLVHVELYAILVLEFKISSIRICEKYQVQKFVSISVLFNVPQRKYLAPSTVESIKLRQHPMTIKNRQQQQHHCYDSREKDSTDFLQQVGNSANTVIRTAHTAMV